MTKPLAVSLWFASLLLASAALLAQPAVGDSAADLLASKDLGSEADVTAWLRRHGDNEANRRKAKWLFDYGMRESRRKNWSGAAKGFAESAVHYPGAAALREYANARLRMMVSVRERDGRTDENAAQDLRRAVDTYRAALASDAVVKTLSAQERSRLQADIHCVDEYLRSKKARRDCRPLVYYELKE